MAATVPGAAGQSAARLAEEELKPGQEHAPTQAPRMVEWAAQDWGLARRTKTATVKLAWATRVRRMHLVDQSDYVGISKLQWNLHSTTTFTIQYC